ncbi:MAG: hypothetical protein EB168_07850 [Euryarchaeota archaeon]|nr:hypothetical protein [Euryarchaeota archaeon]
MSTDIKKKYSGVYSLAFELEFDDPEGNDVSDQHIVCGIQRRLASIIESGDVQEACGPPIDIEEIDPDTGEPIIQKPEQQACIFYHATDLVPTGWREWFWSIISDSAPFSWGDNNRSMVTASDFYRHCAARLTAHEVIDEYGVPEEEYDQFFELLDSLGEEYIDLEN